MQRNQTNPTNFKSAVTTQSLPQTPTRSNITNNVNINKRLITGWIQMFMVMIKMYEWDCYSALIRIWKVIKGGSRRWSMIMSMRTTWMNIMLLMVIITHMHYLRWQTDDWVNRDVHGYGPSKDTYTRTFVCGSADMQANQKNPTKFKSAVTTQWHVKCL